MDDAALERFRQRLTARLAELHTASGATAGDRRPVELDQQSVGRLSRMDAMQVQEMARAAERRRVDEARRIEAALRRMAEDEYGWCQACGDEIAPRRLEVDPTAARCIRCAGAG